MDGSSGRSLGASSPSAAIQIFTAKYMKRSKSISILWGIFTVCSAILNVIVFMQEEWVGDTQTSKSPGHFGIWKFCTVLSGRDDTNGATVKCFGSLDDFASILSPAFRAATVFVGVSVLVGIVVVVTLILFCFLKSQTVFEICGSMQFISGVCMCLGILCFPAGWDNDHVRGICGSSSDNYLLGDCGIRWTFVLAIVSVLDAWILGSLAFILSRRHTKPIYDMPGIADFSYLNQGYKAASKGLIGEGQSLDGKSMAVLPHPSSGLLPRFLHDGPPPPIVPPPPPEVYSDFRNGGGRTVSSPHQRHNFSQQQSISNFQL